MRFQTRAFLFSFLPFAFLLALSFLLVQHRVQGTVREGLRTSLRRDQETVARIRDANSLQNKQSLKTAAADQDLLAALTSKSSPQPDPQSVDHPTADIAESDPAEAPTLQDQVLRLGVRGGHDIVVLRDAQGTTLAGAVRAGDGSSELVPLYVPLESSDRGILIFRGEPYQTENASLQENGQEIGSLSVGERLNPSLFATSYALLRGNRALHANIEGVSLLDIGTQLGRCGQSKECDVNLRGNQWMSVPILANATSVGWTLYSLVNVDQATAPVIASIRTIFLWVAVLSLVVTLLCSFFSSRAIVQPIAAMVDHLLHSAKAGVLPEFKGDLPNVFEVKRLASTYNLAAANVRNAQEDLQSAYVEFVYSLANALDARDKYTSGHSKRVSDLCCAIAAAMGQSEADVERLRIGALLHDIGKIGVSDLLLQKPGRLSEEEFKLIKRHPAIGRRILQGVQGFAKYLPAVELHHENWDGTGYPKRQRGEEIPLDARIIHVADAYDAMTTDRSYRDGLTHDRALDILADNAGTQFDPDVVAVLITITERAANAAADPGLTSPKTRPASAPYQSTALPFFVQTQDTTLMAQHPEISEQLENDTYPVC